MYSCILPFLSFFVILTTIVDQHEPLPLKLVSLQKGLIASGGCLVKPFPKVTASLYCSEIVADFSYLFHPLPDKLSWPCPGHNYSQIFVVHMIRFFSPAPYLSPVSDQEGDKQYIEICVLSELIYEKLQKQNISWPCPSNGRWRHPLYTDLSHVFPKWSAAATC
jgi:hypothetical protein